MSLSSRSYKRGDLVSWVSPKKGHLVRAIVGKEDPWSDKTLATPMNSLVANGITIPTTVPVKLLIPEEMM